MFPITVEPLIKDPPRKGQPLYKGHFSDLQKCTCNTKDKMAGPKVSFTQRFHIMTVHMAIYSLECCYCVWFINRCDGTISSSDCDT